VKSQGITNEDEAHEKLGAKLVSEYGIRESAYMTSCYTCHR